jgi:hypothetical protein
LPLTGVADTKVAPCGTKSVTRMALA